MLKPCPVFVPQRRCIACPACGRGEIQIEHLFRTERQEANPFGPWSCKECGVEFKGVANVDGTVEAEPTGKRDIKTRCLVRLRPDVSDLFFEVAHKAYAGRQIGADGARYWFEEHTCVLNFLRAGKETWEGDRHDPHGLFELLDERPEPEPDVTQFGVQHDRAAFTVEDIRHYMGRARRAIAS